MLVGQHPEAPAARPGGLAQRALHRPAAALKEVAAEREGDGGEHEEHQGDGEQPYRVR